MIKARLSTLAISCMTPEQAAIVAQSKGQGAAGEAGGQTPPAAGAAGNGSSSSSGGR